MPRSPSRDGMWRSLAICPTGSRESARTDLIGTLQLRSTPACYISARMAASTRPISDFIDKHFLHFNAATLRDATDAYVRHLERGGSMFMTLAGAMSTAELGISLAEMIRRDKVQAITCT